MRSSRSPIIVRPPCPDCGGPMMLSTIEPATKRGYDKRFFRCTVCGHQDNVTVKSESLSLLQNC
jgi:hypothetical protein